MLSDLPIISESMVWGMNEQGKDTSIVATIRIDEEELAEAKEGKTLAEFTDEELEEMMWEAVDVLNKDLPVWKKIKRIVIKREEFEKTTGKKIKRFVDANKG